MTGPNNYTRRVANPNKIKKNKTQHTQTQCGSPPISSRTIQLLKQYWILISKLLRRFSGESSNSCTRTSLRNSPKQNCKYKSTQDSHIDDDVLLTTEDIANICKTSMYSYIPSEIKQDFESTSQQGVKRIGIELPRGRKANIYIAVPKGQNPITFDGNPSPFIHRTPTSPTESPAFFPITFDPSPGINTESQEFFPINIYDESSPTNSFNSNDRRNMSFSNVENIGFTPPPSPVNPRPITFDGNPSPFIHRTPTESPAFFPTTFDCNPSPFIHRTPTSPTESPAFFPITLRVINTLRLFIEHLPLRVRCSSHFPIHLSIILVHF